MSVNLYVSHKKLDNGMTRLICKVCGRTQLIPNYFPLEAQVGRKIRFDENHIKCKDRRTITEDNKGD